MFVPLITFSSILSLFIFPFSVSAFVHSDRIETCPPNLFLKGNTGDITYHGSNLFVESTVVNSKMVDGVKEEVLLFDWDELLRDISPVLEKCIETGGGPFCNDTR